MATLSDIHQASEAKVVTHVDDTTPAGHFTATTKYLGLINTYLLAGEQDDPRAVIVGRIEHTWTSSHAWLRSDWPPGTVLTAEQARRRTAMRQAAAATKAAIEQARR